MINWFNMPSEGLSNGGQFEIKELTATENKTYEKDGEVYNKVTVNVSGGGSSDFSTAEVSVFMTQNETDNFKEMDFITIGENAGDIRQDSTYQGGLYKIVLYKGLFVLYTNTDTFVSVTGNATYEIDEEFGDVTISVTGDCTITINPSRVG